MIITSLFKPHPVPCFNGPLCPQSALVQEYVKSSNARIADYQVEVNKLRSLLPYDQMTMEDFRDAFPDQALDPINRPTFWPHTPEEQPGGRPSEPSAH